MSKEEVRMVVEELDSMPAVLASEIDNELVRRATDRISRAKSLLNQYMRREYDE